MIVGIQGNQGKGKTALLAWLAEHYFKLGFSIHANFWLDIPECEPHFITTLNDIDHIFHGYLFADEFWSWVDSRGSGFSDINQAVTSILMKARKRGYSVFYESKRMHFTDRRIRELTDYVLEPEIYYNNNGSLEVIEQNMLEPIDLKPYLNDLWVIAEKYQIISETKMRKMDDNEGIMFKLSDIIDKYDTKEEIGSLSTGERSAGIEKGILKENKLIKYIKSIDARTVILHNHNSLGWDIRTDFMAFDCVSIQKRAHSTRPYIDIRGKKIDDLLLDAKKQKKIPYWVWHFKNEWFCIRMIPEHAQRSILNTSQGEPLKEVLKANAKAKELMKDSRIDH